MRVRATVAIVAIYVSSAYATPPPPPLASNGPPAERSTASHASPPPTQPSPARPPPNPWANPYFQWGTLTAVLGLSSYFLANAIDGNRRVARPAASPPRFRPHPPGDDSPSEESTFEGVRKRGGPASNRYWVEELFEGKKPLVADDALGICIEDCIRDLVDLTGWLSGLPIPLYNACLNGDQCRPLAVQIGGWLPYNDMVAALAREDNRPDNDRGQSMAQLAWTELKNVRLGPNLLSYKQAPRNLRRRPFVSVPMRPRR